MFLDCVTVKNLFFLKTCKRFLQVLNCVTFPLPKTLVKNLIKHLIENQTIRIQKVNPNVDPNYHAFYIIVNKNRENFLEYLYNSGIQAYVGYESLHYSSYAKSINLNLDLPNTQEITPYVVRLPLHTSLKKKHVIYICRKVREYIDGK